METFILLVIISLSCCVFKINIQLYLILFSEKVSKLVGMYLSSKSEDGKKVLLESFPYLFAEYLLS